MREYLLKKEDGTYSYHNDSHDECPKYVEKIEIPEGCNIITCENRKGNLVYFHWKSLDSDEFFLKDEKIWSNNFDETLSDFIEKNEGSVVIIWSRPTQPEELPFVDDRPLLQTATGSGLDQVAKNNDLRERYSGETDEDYRYMLEHYISQKKEWLNTPAQSLNDQYAEIEQVRQESQAWSNPPVDRCADAKPNNYYAMNEADALFADAVNHPSHYASSSIECIDAMRAMLTPEQFIGYLRGNIFKYQWRYENKGGIQDLEKSQWYLNRLLSVLQS